MSEKVTHIYAVAYDYLEDKVGVVKAEVVKETAKLYWIPTRGHAAFNYHQKIYKEEAHTTRKDALVKYREILAGDVRYASHKLSEANDKLDAFNAQFKEELS